MNLDPEVWRNVFAELVGPDQTQTQPILGFRINRVQLIRRLWGKPVAVLRGAAGYAWEAGRNEAVCLSLGRTPHGQPGHVAPASECGCGFYAVHDADQLSRYPGLADEDSVLTGVAGTGIVRVHTLGWRAQFARIIAFSVELPPTARDALTPRERRVLELRFGLIDGHQRSLEEVGKRFGIAGERIRQIEAKALQKVRNPSRFTSVQRRLSATVAEALEAKYQVPIVPLDSLKQVMAAAGNFWEDMR